MPTTTNALPISADEIASLSGMLCGSYSCDLAEGRIHVRVRALPEGTPAAAAVKNGELWVVMDCDQPMAVRHARALLRECCQVRSVDGQVAPGSIYGAIPFPRQSVDLALVS
jgi:hypothetical protein